MKNIHIIPTHKPSKLVKRNLGLIRVADNFTKSDLDFILAEFVNIYITSDEEIKDVRPHKGKWQLETGQILNKFPNYLTDLSECKLVIMTTDQNLIKNGVQAIDDEFLEWFVKNPSCEKIEVRKIEDELISPKNPKIRFNALQDPPSFISAESLNNMILTYKYKIINPKEPKPIHEQIIDAVGGADRFREIVGIKHQQKHSYTEEDVKNAFLDGWQLRDGDLPFLKAKKKWFNEFKNK